MASTQPPAQGAARAAPRSNRTRLGIGLLLLAGATACADGPESENDAVRTAVEPLSAPLAVADPADARIDFVRPRQVAAADDGWVVLDVGTSQIAVLAPDLGVVRVWGEPGEGPDELSGPVSLAAMPDGTIAVLERGRRAVSFWRDGVLAARHAVSATPGTYVIEGDGRSAVCWPAPEAFRECVEPGGEITQGPAWTPPQPEEPVLPFPALLALGGDGVWYRYENATGALFREAGSGDQVEALLLPPELEEALAMPELSPVGGMLSLGYGGVHDMQVTADGTIHFVLEHPTEHEIVRWSPRERLVRHVPAATEGGRVWSIAFGADDSSVKLRDEAIELRMFGGAAAAPTDRLVVSVGERVAAVEYHSDDAGRAADFVSALGAVDRLTVTVAPGVSARAVASVVTAARDAGVGRVDVREAEGERAEPSEAVSVRAESLTDDHFAGLEDRLGAVATRVTVRVPDDVSYGRVSRVETLLIELGLPRVAFHSGGAATGA